MNKILEVAYVCFSSPHRHTYTHRDTKQWKISPFQSHTHFANTHFYIYAANHS